MQRIKFLAGIAMVAVATLICGVFLWPVAELPRSQALADGSVLTVEAISIGNSNYFREPSPKAWQLAIGKRLPYMLAAALGWRFDTRGNWTAIGNSLGMTNLTIFTKREGPGPAGSDQIQVVVLDDQGHGLGWQNAGHSSAIQDAKGTHYHQLQSWNITAFPRQGKNLVVRFLRKQGTSDADAPIMQFHVTNPKPGPYPTWRPEPWPTTKRAGDVAVRLTEFTTGLSMQDPTRAALENEEAVTQVTFELEGKGRTSFPWKVSQVEISDATGNRWNAVPRESVTKTRQQSGTQTINLAGNLWPGEPAWKLRVKLPTASDLPAGELATMAGIVLPPPGSSLPLSQTTNIGGTTIRLQNVETKKPSSGAKASTLSATISYTAEGMPEDGHVGVVRVTDEQGREAQIWPGNEWQLWKKSFDLTVPSDAARLNCTFGVRKDRFVEFVARPRRLSSKAMAR